MNNTNHASRQNRALVITLAVILAFAAVLICLTLMQDRREKPQPFVPQDSSGATDGKAPDTSAHKGSDVPSTSAPVDTDAPKESDTTPAVEPKEEAEPAIAEEKLPDFISPLSGMISKSHALDVPVYSLTMNDYRTHSGVDIVSAAGASVCATADGTVGEIWEDPMMGTCLTIEHMGGARSIYKNLSPQLPESIVTGVRVKAGEKIASIGESALAEVAESPHLHYELEVDGVLVNPADYMLIGSEDTGYEG